jgi:hypothetical protein
MMNIERTVKIYTKLETTIADIYSGAKYYKPSSTELHMKAVKAVSEYKGLPRWAIEYLMGYIRAEDKDIMQNHVLWGVWHEGFFYRGWNDMPQTLQDSIMAENPTVFMNHYWLETKKEWQVDRFVTVQIPTKKRYT